MRVLVTAFKPFNKAPNNYSMEVLNYIDGVDKVVLDVLYDDSYFELKKTKNLDNYDIIIAMGEARMRNELTLEIKAKNISSCSLPDNSGLIKKDEKIIASLGDFLETKVNVEEIKNLVTLSFDAGKFVCNNIYFHLLANYPKKALFIHIPNCHDNEQKYKNIAIKINEIINLLTK